MMKQRIELRGEWTQRPDLRQVLLVTRQRCQVTQPAVGRAMVNRFKPRPQPGIEVGQIGDPAFIELAEKLVPEGTVPALQLAFALVMISKS